MRAPGKTRPGGGSTVFVYIPTGTVCPALCVNSNHDALSAEFLGCIMDQLWIVNSR